MVGLKKIGVSLIPVVLVLFAASVLIGNYQSRGYFLEKDIDLSGGIQLTLLYKKPVDVHAFEAYLDKELSTRDVRVRTSSDPTSGEQRGIIIEAGVSDEPRLISAVESFLGVKNENWSVTNFGSSLANSFWVQAQKAFIWAFIFMAGILFLTFRRLSASFTILLSITADLITTVGMMAYFDIRLSLASIAALLMILGYGVDSGVVLVNKVLRERAGTVDERVRDARRTGLTMSATTLSTLAVLYLLSTAPTLKVISSVLFIGLFTDLLFTWIFNVDLLKLILARHARAKEAGK